MGFLNEGKEIIWTEYHRLLPLPNGNILTMKDGKYGVIDHLGRQVVACHYNALIPHLFNGALPLLKNGDLYLYSYNGRLRLRAKGVVKLYNGLEILSDWGEVVYYGTFTEPEKKLAFSNSRQQICLVNDEGDLIAVAKKNELTALYDGWRRKYFLANSKNGMGILAVDDEEYERYKEPDRQYRFVPTAGVIVPLEYDKIEAVKDPGWLMLQQSDSTFFTLPDGKLITKLASKSFLSVYHTHVSSMHAYTIASKDGCRQTISFNKLVYTTCGDEMVLPVKYDLGLDGNILLVKRVNTQYGAIGVAGDTIVPFQYDTFYTKADRFNDGNSPNDVAFVSKSRLLSLKATLGSEDKIKKDQITKPYHVWTNDSVSFILDSNYEIAARLKGKATLHQRVFRGKRVFQIAIGRDTQYFAPALQRVISKSDLNPAPYTLLTHGPFFSKSNKELFAKTFRYIAPVDGLGFVGADELNLPGLLDQDTNLLVKFDFYDETIGFYDFVPNDSTFFLKHIDFHHERTYWKLYRLNNKNEVKALSYHAFALPFQRKKISPFQEANGLYGLLNTNKLETLVSPKYSHIAQQPESAYFFYSQRTNWEDQSTRTWCLIVDTVGNKLCEGFVESVSLFRNEKAVVVAKDFVKVINLQGEQFDAEELSLNELEAVVTLLLPSFLPISFHPAWTNKQRQQYLLFLLRRFLASQRQSMPVFENEYLQSEKRLLPAHSYSGWRNTIGSPLRASSKFMTTEERLRKARKEPKPYESHFSFIQSASTLSVMYKGRPAETYRISNSDIWQIQADNIANKYNSPDKYLDFNDLIRSKLEQIDTISLDCSLTDDYVAMVGDYFTLNDDALTLYFYDNNTRRRFPVRIEREDCEAYFNHWVK